MPERDPRGTEIKLNIFNASTFACDSLLREFPFERPKIRYYYPSESGVKRRRMRSDVDRAMAKLKWLLRGTPSAPW